MCDFFSRNKQLFEQLDSFIDTLATKEGSLIQVLTPCSRYIWISS